MSEPRWPDDWQPEAIAALRPWVGGDEPVEIVVGDPRTTKHGTLLAGFVSATADGDLWIVHDRSGRPDVYPWRLLAGPVLRISVRRLGRRRRDVFVHPTRRPAPTTR